MGTRGTISILLVGVLVLVLAAGAALAAQEDGDRAKDESSGKDSTSAQNGDDRNDGDLTLELQGRPTSANSSVDLGQQGASPGDQLIFSDELFRPADSQSEGQESSQKIGQADGRCTLIDPNSERFLCTVVSSFENGTIVTEGVLSNKENSPNASSVTGGTGEYRGVTGEATLDLAPAQGPHAIRFDLQRDDDASRPDRETTTGQDRENTTGQQEKTREETQAKTNDTKNENTNGESTAQARSKDSAGKAEDKARNK